jgi:hypothetical protein
LLLLLRLLFGLACSLLLGLFLLFLVRSTHASWPP